MRALTKKLFRDLWNLKIQTLTISIIVTGGLALLISSWSSYESLQNSRQNFYDRYIFADLFAEMKRAPQGIEKKLQNIPGISLVEGRIVIDGLASIQGQDEPAVMRLVSLPASGNSILNKLFLRQGRLPVESAEVSEVVLHEAFAKAHGILPGQFVQVLVEGKHQKLQVVGIGTSPEYIYAISSISVLPDDVHFGLMWVPYKTLSRLSERQDSINSISAVLESNANPQAVIKELDRKLAPYGTLGTYQRKDQLSHRFLEDEMKQQKGTAIVTPVIFLSVAAFLVHIIFSRLISLNRPQIATLKALGMSDKEVSMHFFTLVFCMILLGIIPGILFGVYVGKLFAHIYLEFYHFPNLNYTISARAVIAGVFAGLLPAMMGAWQSISRVFKLTPATAMRPPTPPAFQQNLLDKIIPSGTSPLNKIILRNLFHRPDRLLMITMGMATSLGILITAMSWGGMVSEFMSTQFQRVQRENIEITFLHPVDLNSLQTLRHKKGVLAVEGYRSVPIRIHHLHLKKEIPLTGIPEKPLLRQSIDTNLRPVPLPEYGILLGRFFSERWKIRKGDTVDIEVLDGRQQKFSIVVSGISDEFFGLSATMKIGDLLALLDEAPGVNRVLLTADPAELTHLYVELKNIPEIGSIVFKNFMYRGFQSTMGNIISVATIILISFALAIGIGVIYNSIRVNFAERSWEMATLEVMGMKKNDVFTIIFLEVSLQVLCSLVPGCFIGHWMTVISFSDIHTETFAMPIIIRLETYAKGIMIVILTLLFCSLLMYRMIGRLNLVDALKARD